jgi:chromosome segregation ATPase
MDHEEISRFLFRIEEKIDQSNMRGQIVEAVLKETVAQQDRLESKIDESVKKSDERHKETTGRLDKVEKTLQTLSSDDSAIRNEVRRIERRTSELEHRMDKQESRIDKVHRTSDEGDHMQQAALQSAINIQTKAIQTMQEEMVKAEEFRSNDSKMQQELLRRLVGWKDAWWFKGAVLGTAIVVSGCVTILKDCKTVKDTIHQEEK